MEVRRTAKICGEGLEKVVYCWTAVVGRKRNGIPVTSLGTRRIVMTVGDYKNKKGRAAVKRKIEEGTLRHGEGTGRHVDDMGCHFPPKR